MPELPEVTTTVNGLNEVLPRLTITDIWTDYFLRTKNKRTDTIKNKKYFEYFKKEIVGEKVKKAERRGKNVLIHLTHGKTILIHMKMTGHLLYGKYKKSGETWRSEDKLLRVPFNQFVHLVFTMSNGKHLAFSDMRKFAKVVLFETDSRDTTSHLADLGPEPLDDLTLETFKTRLQTKPEGKIKTVLMDQSVIAGIGNIYSDEILWETGIHPERKVKKLKEIEIKDMLKAMKKILLASIKMGGDSMSDYRDIYGQKGNLQNAHKVYRRVGEKCSKKNCSGKILRKIIGGRSSHFCSNHQK